MNAKENSIDREDAAATLLREEILAHLDKAYQFTASKIGFATTLLGISTANFPVFSDKLVLLTPFVALAYDIFIINEKYSTLRIGHFLGEDSNAGLMKKWEQHVNGHRSCGMPLSHFILDIFILLLSSYIYTKGFEAVSFNFLLLFIFFLISFILLFLIFVYLRRIFIIHNYEGKNKIILLIRAIKEFSDKLIKILINE